MTLLCIDLLFTLVLSKKGPMTTIRLNFFSYIISLSKYLYIFVKHLSKLSDVFKDLLVSILSPTLDFAFSL